MYGKPRQPDPRGATSVPPAVHQREYVSVDLRALYAHMRPDERTAIALQFMHRFSIAGGAKRLRLVPGDRTRGQMLSADQVAELHTYMLQHAPSVLVAVFHHPVTQHILAAHPTVAAVDPIATTPSCSCSGVEPTQRRASRCAVQGRACPCHGSLRLSRLAFEILQLWSRLTH